jgi:hypothetical protein
MKSIADGSTLYDPNRRAARYSAHFFKTQALTAISGCNVAAVEWDHRPMFMRERYGGRLNALNDSPHLTISLGIVDHYPFSSHPLNHGQGFPLPSLLKQQKRRNFAVAVFELRRFGKTPINTSGGTSGTMSADRCWLELRSVCLG